MSIHKFIIEFEYDTDDSDWIGYSLEDLSGNDPVDTFIEYTLPLIVEEKLHTLLTQDWEDV